MPVGIDTHAYRGRLPHLVRRERMYYVTFCTRGREVLPPQARDLVLASCVREHETAYWIDTVVVMPDHVHTIVMPYETTNLASVLRRIKGRSAYQVNRHSGRSGALWQRESFDRMVRSGDNLEKKRVYILENPVRAGLVERWEDYRWIWVPA